MAQVAKSQTPGTAVVLRAKMKPRGKPFTKGERDPRAYKKGQNANPVLRDAKGNTPAEIRAALRLAFAERIPFLRELIDGTITKIVYEKTLRRRTDKKGQPVEEELIAAVTRVVQVDEDTRLRAMDLLVRYGVGLQVDHDIRGEVEHRHYVVRAPLQSTVQEWDTIHPVDPKPLAGGNGHGNGKK